MLDQLAIPMQDSLLIQQVARGDTAAFEQLYQRYEVPVFTYLCRLLLDEGCAEELMQEVFFAVWKGAPGFRGQSTVKTWIFHIAHNQAVSWFRKNRRIENLDDLEFADDHEGPEGISIQRWKNEQIRKGLAVLSPDHRAVIELAFYFELSVEEISVILGCPVGTVKSRACYARRSLEGWLRRNVNDEGDYV